MSTQSAPDSHPGISDKGRLPVERSSSRPIPRPDESVINAVGLTKIFRDFWMRNRVRAVDGINLEVNRGEVFGLLGPNGSGKSTTIKLMLGLLHPTAGRVLVLGRRPDEVYIKKRIGYLPEETYLYRFLNARETLDYYGRLFFQGRSQRQKRIDMLLEMVGLTTVQRRPVGEYSKGMQRRIGLAQALINDPDLLILDEPTTGLDPIGTRQIKDLIFELAQRGKTVLLCSHLLADVEDVCHRVAIMFGGKIRKAGTVDELLLQAGRTTLQTATLDVNTIQQIEQVLERQGKHIEKVEQPRQRLEHLFLDIVYEAMREGAETSGAEAGGRIANFLMDHDNDADIRGAHLPETSASLVEKLISQTPEVTAESDVHDSGADPKAHNLQAIDELIQPGPEPTTDDAGETRTDDATIPRSTSQAGQETDQSLIDALLDTSSPDDEPRGDGGQGQEGGVKN